MGIGTIAPAVLVSIAILPTSMRHPPLMVYYRRGGVSGLIENLVVYSEGMGVYRRDGEEIKGRMDESTISALEMVLRSISDRGFSEVSAKPGAVDFFHHEVIYPKRGERFAWVDEWASEIELPRELRVLTKLLDYAISQVVGTRWVNWDEMSTAYLRMRASLDGLIVRGDTNLLLRVSVACLNDVGISYTLPSPDSPDVEVRSDVEVSVDFLRMEGRIIDGRRRRLTPGEELEIEASIGLRGAGRGPHWISIYFPPKNPSVEVSLPIVVL